MTLTFPEIVVPQCLRDHHPDLAGMDDAQILDHWLKYGEAEGRVGSYPALREHFIPMAQASGGAILEIGPFNCPAIEGDNVKYLDVLSAAELHDRAVQIGLDPGRCPKKIHYSSLDEVNEHFDIVFSSHNVEHHPDLVKHLSDVSRVLAPDGVFMMMIPDKRFCFDHFIPESSIADVLDARGRSVHSLRSVIEHLTMTTHNDALSYWRGDAGPAPDPMVRLPEALEKFAEAGGNYLDVHAWQFTPRSFASLISILQRLGISTLRPDKVYATPLGRHEFAAVLRK